MNHCDIALNPGSSLQDYEVNNAFNSLPDVFTNDSSYSLSYKIKQIIKWLTEDFAGKDILAALVEVALRHDPNIMQNSSVPVHIKASQVFRDYTSMPIETELSTIQTNVSGLLSQVQNMQASTNIAELDTFKTELLAAVQRASTLISEGIHKDTDVKTYIRKEIDTLETSQKISFDKQIENLEKHLKHVKLENETWRKKMKVIYSKTEEILKRQEQLLDKKELAQAHGLS